MQALETGEISSGQGKNQETSLKRPEDTHWGSHYVTLCRILLVDMLENVFKDGSSDDNCGISTSLISKMESYEFVFILHLMKTLLGMTNVLSQALQRKDQDIIGAVNLIESVQSDL